MPEITKDTVIGQVLAMAPDAAPVFMNMGMHCLFCPASQGESIEEACYVHGIDPDELLAELNEFLAAKEAE